MPFTFHSRLLLDRDQKVCRSIDVRNSVANLEILRNCTVVEGFVQILLIDHAGEDSYANISFPKLREITGYLVLYRVNGLRTLENLFPNLSVIRGNTLFFNYALVVFEMLHMQRIGLPSLTDIMRGAVRIEKNPNLCFVDTIDWDMIAKAGKGEHFIAGNKQNNQCPKCAAHSKCPTSPVSNVTLCWNGTKCQKVCQYEGSCNETGERCHDMCLGGCSGPSSEDCYVCKKVVFGKDCLSECPANTYEYLNRRCIDSKECLEMPPPVENDIRGGNSWKIFNKTCIVECPPGYVSVNNNSCERCNSSCRKECPGNNVDSIAAAQELRGCTYIKGALEIQIRGIGNEEGGKNIVMELEDNLQMIEEIEDYLKIIRSFPLVSLNFLKNLSVIHGKKLDQYKYSLVVVENQNLQELWDRDSKKDMVKILNGRPFFHFNPKLCISKIDQIKQANFTNFTDIEVAKSSNGDKVPCNVSELKVRVTIKTAAGAVITWNAFKHHDPRSLLGYVVYVKEAPTQNVTLYDGRDACGGDGWQVYDVDPNGNSTENTHLITHLKAYTQYAFYVRTYTIATETTGAQSKIHYFRTEPDEPSKPLHLKAFSNSSHELIIQWMPPQSPNGNLTHYKIIGTWEKDDPELLEQRDYCVEPLTLPDKKPVVIIPEEDKKADKDTCACDEKNKKINKQKEKEVQFQIHFENFLHNKVYVKRNDRLRRDIRDFAEDGDLRSGYSNIQLLKEKDYLSNRDVLSYGDDDISNTSPSPPFSQPHPDIELNVVGIKHVLRELRNFAEYTIAVQACRETTEKEKINLSYVKYCSTKSIVTARTLKLDGADDIDSKSLAIDVFNETAGSVRLRWKEPERPNGIIVTYQIEYRRVDIENYKPVVECITRRHYQENGNSYTLKNLQPGKYKLRLRATSLAGNGAYTKMEEFDIKESTSSPVEDKLVYVITGAFISITLTVIIMILFKRKFGTKVPNMKLIASVNPEYVSAVYIPDEWEVARKKIELLRELGQGSFGMVYEGIARDVVEGKPEIRCAIKTVNEHATDRERIEFLNEASVMKAFNTHHVVQLLGVVSQGQPTLVVMELMANGDLKTYLRSHRPDAGVDHGKQPPTLKRILQMAIEIADGMAYLAAKKFVHRDLAARNCMVADDLTVKIGDFGMTRDIYETDYYRKGTKGLLPVRWMAPESLKDGVFTSFSDVWSYGVVLWEMATLASQPYQGLSNDQVLRYVIDGGVMERPENCPDKLYELMRICWQHKPVHRPTFLTLVSMLETDASPSFLHVSFYHSQEAEELRSHDTALAVPRAACIPIQGARIAEIEDDDDEEEEVGVVQTPTTPLRLTRDVEDFSVGGDSGSDVSMDEEGGEQEEGDREGRKEFSHRSERKGSGDEGGAKMHGGSGSSSGRWASMGGDGSKGMSVYSSDSSKGSKVSNGSAAANGYVMGRHNSFGVLKTTEC
ncbi:insulin-like peptide receptor [Ischnura elegans]|uniref:insulin-like peptide receptor n=1 Tax=Ischnura elegans TaxID=197161 RepID=UPI001ED86DAC|nr:insulin-like peptide receptor [Ischnura elegans]